MKKVQLVERSSAGRIFKNESYSYGQLRKAVMAENGNYFHDFFLGGFRRKVLERILETFERLTNKDKPGQHTLPK